MSSEQIIRLSRSLGNFTERVGKFGSWFILPLVFVTMWDVFARKVGGIQYYLVQKFGGAL